MSPRSTVLALALAASFAGGGTAHAGTVRVRAFDGQGEEVDLARSHASIERTPPERLDDDPFAKSPDPDAIRFELEGSAEELPASVTLASFGDGGAAIDSLAGVALIARPCSVPSSAGLTCKSTLPIRAVVDDLDRFHPLVKDRSIKVELGGTIAVVSPGGDKMQMVRVGGPRHSALGSIERFRAKLRILMVRLVPHGPPPMGGDDPGAIAVARAEVARANALWGACGISFGKERDLDIAVVDPPKPHMLAIGCDHGLPASGGTIHVRVDGRDVSAKIGAGVKPSGAARVVAQAVASAGFVAKVSDNPVMLGGAYGSSDVLVRRKDGALVTIEPPATGAITTDATLGVCIGRVDLDDGLQHFGDVDAVAGTVEERALIKAFDDGDPTTIEVFLLPSFAGGGRIGESFISADAGSIRNVLIEDRAGVRADNASFALAHEVGHILLDDPGHPDDFGADTPTRLMDADAASATAYGPRRLLVSECERALRQSAPRTSASAAHGADPPLLAPWPLAQLGPLGRSATALDKPSGPH